MAYVRAHGDRPRAMIVGRDLFELYETELTPNMRWVAWGARPGIAMLLFKGAIVVPQGRGYGIRAVKTLEWRGNAA